MVEVIERPVEEVIEEQQALAKDLLSRFGDFVNQTGRVAVAGGAPRDWDHNKAAKDIDIFLNVGHEKNSPRSITEDKEEGRKVIAKTLGLPLTDVVDADENDTYTGGEICWVFNILNLIWPVQIIGIKWRVADQVQAFPVSISKIMYDYDGNFYRDVWYKIGEVFNVIYHPNLNDGIGEYVNRVLSKYPEKIPLTGMDVGHYRSYFANVDRDVIDTNLIRVW